MYLFRVVIAAAIGALAAVAVQRLAFDASNPAVTGGVAGAVAVLAVGRRSRSKD